MRELLEILTNFWAEISRSSSVSGLITDNHLAVGDVGKTTSTRIKTSVMFRPNEYNPLDASGAGRPSSQTKGENCTPRIIVATDMQNRNLSAEG